MARVIAVALTLGALLWGTAVIAAAPAAETGPFALAYRFGSVVCHQRPERSFSLDGQPLAVCARCTGLYLSGALGALLAWLGHARAPNRAREILILATVPTFLTIPVEWTGVSHLSNAVRAVAALPVGAAAGWIFIRALRSEADAL